MNQSFPSLFWTLAYAKSGNFQVRQPALQTKLNSSIPQFSLAGWEASSRLHFRFDAFSTRWPSLLTSQQSPADLNGAVLQGLLPSNSLISTTAHFMWHSCNVARRKKNKGVCSSCPAIQSTPISPNLHQVFIAAGALFSFKSGLLPYGKNYGPPMWRFSTDVLPPISHLQPKYLRVCSGRKCQKRLVTLDDRAD
jgi:hypothetical protein